MTYTFDPSLSTDLALVRFHIGDTNSEGAYLQDETIHYWINNSSTIGMAVVKCIQYIITQLSSPNFRLDWMSVSNEQARAGYENMLKIKQQEFGINRVTATSSISSSHRADSYENADGVYTDPDGAPA